MDWVRTRKRVETRQALSSISAPPLPLLAVFAIVIFLLSLSHYAAYRELMHFAMFNFKILLFVAPLLLLFLLRSSLHSSVRWIHFRWGVVLLLVVLLLLLSYQSSLHSRWFPFGSSD